MTVNNYYPTCRTVIPFENSFACSALSRNDWLENLSFILSSCVYFIQRWQRRPCSLNNRRSFGSKRSCARTLNSLMIIVVYSFKNYYALILQEIFCSKLTLVITVWCTFTFMYYSILQLFSLKLQTFVMDSHLKKNNNN